MPSCDMRHGPLQVDYLIGPWSRDEKCCNPERSRVFDENRARTYPPTEPVAQKISGATSTPRTMIYAQSPAQNENFGSTVPGFPGECSSQKESSFGERKETVRSYATPRESRCNVRSTAKPGGGAEPELLRERSGEGFVPPRRTRSRRSQRPSASVSSAPVYSHKAVCAAMSVVANSPSPAPVIREARTSSAAAGAHRPRAVRQISAERRRARFRVTVRTPRAPPPTQACSWRPDDRPRRQVGYVRAAMREPLWFRGHCSALLSLFTTFYHASS